MDLQKCKVKVLSPLKEVVKPKDLGEKCMVAVSHEKLTKLCTMYKNLELAVQVKSTPLCSRVSEDRRVQDSKHFDKRYSVKHRLCRQL